MRFNRTRGALMGHDTDASPILLHDVYRNHCGGRRVKMTRPATGALCRPPRGNKTRSGAISKRQRTGSRPPAGSYLEPARPETAGGALRNAASRTGATKPGRKSWDFNESEQDFGEKRNPPKPHASP
jgi:hypothetical protein